MAVSLRTGTYGSYYGNDYNSSNALTQEQMQMNAKYIYSYLTAKGWTKESISAILGNMQAESSINPGRWQSDRVGGDSSGHGYSLTQWTPYTKYTNWCAEQGYSDPSEMDTALSRIIWEVENNEQWIGIGVYSSMSFAEFSQSTLTPGYLARGFLLCYERPKDQSESVQSYRSSLANAWYEYLGGVVPSDPTIVTRRRKRKFNFILMGRRKRANA